MERPITITSVDLNLEGRLNPVSVIKAAVIMHPHPLYGGDMDNAVVACAARAYHKAGWTTLRFNFRGTGLSQDRFDEDIGEQDDLQGAVDHLQNMALKNIELVGYSFGAAVALRWSERHADHSYFNSLDGLEEAITTTI